MWHHLAPPYLVRDASYQREVSRRLWRHFAADTDAVIFVIDSSDQARLEEARDLMLTVLADPYIHDCCTVLLFLNKQVCFFFLIFHPIYPKRTRLLHRPRLSCQEGMYITLHYFSIPSTSTVLSLPYVFSSSLPPFRNSDQPLCHVVGTPLPSPLRCVPSFLYGGKRSAFFFALSTRVESLMRTQARRFSQANFPQKKSYLARFKLTTLIFVVARGLAH